MLQCCVALCSSLVPRLMLTGTLKVAPNISTLGMQTGERGCVAVAMMSDAVDMMERPNRLTGPQDFLAFVCCYSVSAVHCSTQTLDGMPE